MGGNALNSIGIQARRLPAEEFPILLAGIHEASADLFHWIKPVKFHHQKADMGDIDLVGYPKEDKKGREIVNWGEILMERLGSKGYYYNKPVLSLEFNGVQIDIAAKYSDIAAKTYLDFCHYAPIGNVVGRMLKQTGAKWGIDGLTYPIRESHEREENMIGGVPLTTDMQGILALAGLDYQKWEKGFETEEEIFEYCTQSLLFNREIFALENLNHVNRKRDRTRASYRNFLEYIQDVPDKYKRYGSEQERIQRKKEWFEKICKLFPQAHLAEEKGKLLEKVQERRELNQKFNGNLVSEITGLKGKELGVFLSTFKNQFNSSEAYDEWLRKTPNEKIRMRVKETHEQQPDIEI